MAPLIVKLIGAAIGSLLADTLDKKLREKNTAKALPTPNNDGNSVNSNANTVPKGETDDGKKPWKTGSNRGNQRADSGVSDNSDESTGEVKNEPDQ